MHLLELETRHWRGLTRAVGTFSPQLNAIFGPNEAGKSRLFQAIRYGLFESYKGASQHKLALQSWNGVESPFVRIVFDVDGTQFELRKQYLKGGYAELIGGGVTLRNEEAETRVRQLLGSRPGGNREVGPEDMGIWPLLLVRQGSAGLSPGDVLTDDSRSQIQARLAGEIGAAAISEQGAKLLTLAQVEHDRFYTATGQENVTLKNARAQVETATAQLQHEREAYSKQIETSTKLGDARREWDDLQVRVAKARQELHGMRTRAEAAQNAGGKLKSARTQYQLRQAQEERARKDLEALENLITQQGRLNEQIAALDAELQQLQGSERELVGNGDKLREAVARAQEELNLAVERQGMARKANQRQRLIEQQAALTETIVKLEDIGRRLEDAKAKKALIVPMSDATIQKLRERYQSVRDAQAQLAGAAVRVTVTPLQALSIDGLPRGAGVSVPFDVVDDTRLVIDGIATLDVAPGLGSLDQLRAQAEEATAVLTKSLDEAGVETLADAVEANLKGKEIAQEMALLAREAGAVSSRKLEDLVRERTDIDGQLALIGAVTSDLSLDAAIEAAERAGTAVDDARRAKNLNDSALSDLRTKIAGKDSTRQAAADQREMITEQLEGRLSAEELKKAIETAQEATRQASVDMSAAQDAYDHFGGDRAAEDLSRYETAADQLGKRLAEARTRVDTLQGALQNMLTEGSYEKVADAEARLDEASTFLDRLLRQALAAKRLFTLLSTERRKVVEQMTAPVIARIRPYLADVFPGSRLVTGENLEFQGLQTDNMQEDFASLSFGAQDQFALMARIGMAEVLSGGGRLPLILDDSFVNSDPDRIRLMHRTLFRASRTIQIILLTSQLESLFDGLGADYQVRLERIRR